MNTRIPNPSRPPRFRAAGWSRTGVVAVPLMLCLLLSGGAGCYSYEVGTPRPSAVYVARPGEVQATLPTDELWEHYTTSPNRDPDGLGPLEAMWLNSKMTLVVKELRLQVEEGNRVAYARTEAEQQAVLRRLDELFRQSVVFEGRILSDFKELAEAEWYQPEGIYLLDDRGRKFLPTSVESRRSIFESTTTPYWVRFGPVPVGVPYTSLYPYILFPAEAITPETRAITLYFAAFQRRVSFTWIFDESYVPENVNYAPEYGRGLRRMWRNP